MSGAPILVTLQRHRHRLTLWVSRVIVLALAFPAASSAVIVPSDQDAPLDAVYALQELVRARFDRTHHVEVDSDENTEKAREPYISDVSHVAGVVDRRDEVWLLRQRSATSFWHDYGMVVRRGVVYFAVLEGRPRLVGPECAECHPNGPRALAGSVRAGSERSRAEINALVSREGVVKVYYPGSAPAPTASRDLLDVPACMDCHNGEDRSWLSRLNVRAIRYRSSHGTMPPDRRLNADESRALTAWLGAR